MKLQDLIELLKQYPQDYEVIRDDRFTNGVLAFYKNGTLEGMLDCTLPIEQFLVCLKRYPKDFR